MTYIILFVTVAVSILCMNNPQLKSRLMLNPYRVVENREWYRILSHALIHADYVHLAVNMFVFFSFGSYIERLFNAYAHAGTIWNGRLSYLALYIGGAAAASVYDLVKHRRDPYFNSLGASGAVAAVVFASIFFDPWTKLYFFGVIPIPGIVFGVLYLAYSGYAGRKSTDHINHNAHLYGALFGFIYPVLLDPGLFQLFWQKLIAF